MSLLHEGMVATKLPMGTGDATRGAVGVARVGNAVPKNFSWDDLLRFVPEGEQIIAVTPEYRSRRKRRPVSVVLLLSNDEMVRLSLF